MIETLIDESNSEKTLLLAFAKSRCRRHQLDVRVAREREGESARARRDFRGTRPADPRIPPAFARAWASPVVASEGTSRRTCDERSGCLLSSGVWRRSGCSSRSSRAASNPRPPPPARRRARVPPPSPSATARWIPRWRPRSRVLAAGLLEGVSRPIFGQDEDYTLFADHVAFSSTSFATPIEGIAPDDRPGSPGDCFPLLYIAASAYHEYSEDANVTCSSADFPAPRAGNPAGSQTVLTESVLEPLKVPRYPCQSFCEDAGVRRCKDALIIAVNESSRGCGRCATRRQHHRRSTARNSGDVEVLPRE